MRGSLRTSPMMADAANKLKNELNLAANGVESKSEPASQHFSAQAEPSRALPATSAKARQGKMMISGYFSHDLGKALKMLAVEKGVTVQALLGEGIDAVLHQNGKHRFGER